MCGISAAWAWSDSGIAFARLRAMVGAQAHRGPDGRGFAAWTLPRQRRPLRWASADADAAPPEWGRFRLGLGHNLLAIQDASSSALQPMASADGRYWIAYNGEVYNFPELRDRLVTDGSVFRTLTDTEVLLELWARHGSDALPELRGMFAFVLYDSHLDTLWVARDRFGIKPVYYAPLVDGIVLASELRGIHASGLVPRRMREDAVRSFLAAGVNKPDDSATFFEGVLELPPGCLLRVRPGELRTQRYYSLPSVGGTLAGEEAKNELRRRFVDTVALHLRSTREVGACLSGGLDSSNIACAVALQLGDAKTAFQAFTIGRPDSLDAALARETAAGLGVRHHLVHAPPSVPPPDLADMVRALETPNHTWGPINQYLLLRAIAADHHLSVLLDGQGGDEVLSGYPWFVPSVCAYVGERFGVAAGEALRQACARRAPMPAAPLRIAQAIYASRRRWIEVFDGGAVRALGVTREDVAGWAPVQYYLNDDLDWNGMRCQQIFRRELAHVLRHEDRLGMWFSIECRVPFLDHELVEFMGELDPRFLFKDGYAKYPLRKLFSELPEAVRLETRKTGYWESYSEMPPLADFTAELIEACPVLKSLVPRRDRLALEPLAAWRFYQVAVLSGTWDEALTPMGKERRTTPAIVDEARRGTVAC
jgi:asparagine synthase (glutamine-hydrolysing)